MRSDIERPDRGPDARLAAIHQLQSGRARRALVRARPVHEVLDFAHRPQRVAERPAVSGGYRSRVEVRHDDVASLPANAGELRVCVAQLTNVADHEPAPDDVE